MQTATGSAGCGKAMCAIRPCSASCTTCDHSEHVQGTVKARTTNTQACCPLCHLISHLACNNRSSEVICTLHQCASAASSPWRLPTTPAMCLRYSARACCSCAVRTLCGATGSTYDSLRRSLLAGRVCTSDGAPYWCCVVSAAGLVSAPAGTGLRPCLRLSRSSTCADGLACSMCSWYSAAAGGCLLSHCEVTPGSPASAAGAAPKRQLLLAVCQRAASLPPACCMPCHALGCCVTVAPAALLCAITSSNAEFGGSCGDQGGALLGAHGFRVCACCCPCAWCLD